MPLPSKLLFLNRSADQLEVVSEAERRILCAARQVLIESGLVSEAPARTHFAGLSAFRCPDHLCGLNDFGQLLARKEDYASASRATTSSELTTQSPTRARVRISGARLSRR